jgi:uncharacterized membrane protein
MSAMSESEVKRYNTNPLDPEVAERAEQEMGADDVDTEAPTRAMQADVPLPQAGGPTEPVGGDPTRSGPGADTVHMPPAPSGPVVGQPTHGLYTPPPAPQMHMPQYPQPYPPRPPQQAGSAALGLKPNFAAMLGYVPFIGIVGAILLLLAEPMQNRFVRFHAKQALIAQIAFFVVNIVLTIAGDNAPGPLGFLFWLVRFPVFVGAFVGFIMMMAKAYGGERFKIPIIGDQAE